MTKINKINNIEMSVERERGRGDRVTCFLISVLNFNKYENLEKFMTFLIKSSEIFVKLYNIE